MVRYVWATLLAHSWQLLVFALLFLLFELLAPAHPRQPKWRSDSRLDLALSFLGPLMVHPFYLLTALILASSLWGSYGGQTSGTRALGGRDSSRPTLSASPAESETGWSPAAEVGRVYRATYLNIASQSLWVQFLLSLILRSYPDPTAWPGTRSRLGSSPSSPIPSSG